jgi:hypothetical protein
MSVDCSTTVDCLQDVDNHLLSLRGIINSSTQLDQVRHEISALAAKIDNLQNSTPTWFLVSILVIMVLMLIVMVVYIYHRMRPTCVCVERAGYLEPTLVLPLLPEA